MNSITKNQSRAKFTSVSKSTFRRLGGVGPHRYRKLEFGYSKLKNNHLTKSSFVDFRFGGEEDEQQMYGLEAVCFPSRRLKTYLSSYDCLSILAFQGNQLIGYVVFSAEENTSNANIHSLAIRPELRGVGIAAGLLRQTEDLMEATGVRILHLNVRSSNTEAQNYYTHKGFIPIKVVQNHYGPDQHGIKMMKDLSGTNSDGGDPHP